MRSAEMKTYYERRARENSHRELYFGRESVDSLVYRRRMGIICRWSRMSPCGAQRLMGRARRSGFRVTRTEASGFGAALQSQDRARNMPPGRAGYLIPMQSLHTRPH